MHGKSQQRTKLSTNASVSAWMNGRLQVIIGSQEDHTQCPIMYMYNVNVWYENNSVTVKDGCRADCAIVSHCR